MDPMCAELTPGQIAGLTEAVKEGKCSVSELSRAIEREREVEELLGRDLVLAARQTFPDLTLSAYADLVYGSLEELRQQRQEAVMMAREDDSPGLRLVEERLADQLGVSRKDLSVERVRQGRRP